MLKFQVVEEHGQYMCCVTQPIAVGLAACVCVCTAWVPRQQPSLEQGALSSTAWAAQPPIMDCYLSCIAGAKRGLEISKIHAIMEIHQQHYTVKAKFQVGLLCTDASRLHSYLVYVVCYLYDISPSAGVGKTAALPAVRPVRQAVTERHSGAGSSSCTPCRSAAVPSAEGIPNALRNRCLRCLWPHGASLPSLLPPGAERSSGGAVPRPRRGALCAGSPRLRPAFFPPPPPRSLPGDSARLAAPAAPPPPSKAHAAPGWPAEKFFLYYLQESRGSSRCSSTRAVLKAAAASCQKRGEATEE
ncbi:uncharacterized protein LOC121106646 isoform X1 [Gallus gallus]|uniref:uncharacterized protein LOC121106646 isoform X1 n=1 Tax=Gallus gallus TaxID=9031 RepID=UPI001AE528DC|nr:uncharacterized protein LOC121106646 isoform X1 [Gallus gallus]